MELCKDIPLKRVFGKIIVAILKKKPQAKQNRNREELSAGVEILRKGNR